MEFNLAGLRNRVLVDKLDDDEFDPDVVDHFINDTHRDIFNQFDLPFQEKIFKGVIPQNATIFQLPTDLVQLQSHTIAGAPGFNSGKMPWRDFFKMYPDVDNNEPGQPTTWTLYAGNVILSKPADQDYNFTVFYIKRPKTLASNTDIPDVPEEFAEALVLGAYRRVLERNEDFDLAATINQQYLGQIQLMATRYGFRETDGPLKMKNKQV